VTRAGAGHACGRGPRGGRSGPDDAAPRHGPQSHGARPRRQTRAAALGSGGPCQAGNGAAQPGAAGRLADHAVEGTAPDQTRSAPAVARVRRPPRPLPSPSRPHPSPPDPHAPDPTCDSRSDVRTADGYVLRIFVLAFTTKRQNQVRRTCYAKSSQLRQMRARMDRILHRESSSVELKDLVSKFIPEMLGTMIEKACQAIYPLRDVLIRKVKVLRAPKFDLTKLMEVHDNYTTQAGKAVAGASADAAANEDDGVPENVPGAEAA